MASSDRIEELRKKFEENPRRYFAPLANEYRKAGEIEQAISICREYLPQQPGHMSGHIVYGQALYEAREFEEAKSVFETALSLDPENLIALRQLGDIALILGDTEGARGWYGRVLEADPRNEEIQAQLQSLEANAPAPAAANSDAGSAPTPPSPQAIADSQRPTPLASPAVPSLSNATTVVLTAVPKPTPQTLIEEPPSAAPPSMSNAPTAEVKLGNVPAPAVLDVEKFDEPVLEAPSVERASGFEPTSAAEQPAGATVPTLELDTSNVPSAPPIDSFTLEGLETTSFEPPPAATSEPPAQPPATPAPPAPAAADLIDIDLSMPPIDEPPSASAEVPSASQDLPLIMPDEPAAPSVQHPAEPPVAAQPPAPVDDTAAPPVAESGPFVTETMAELYLQQGHREEALKVYRALLDQRPGDAHLLSRIEQLTPRTGPTIRELLRLVAARRPGVRQPDAVAAQANGADVSAPEAPPVAAVPDRAPEAVPAAPETAAPSPDAGAGPSPFGQDVLAAFFGGRAISPADDKAALMLAAAFAGSNGANGSRSSAEGLPGAPARPASKDLSLDSVFGGAAESGGSPKAASFSFDQFFSQRATAEQPTSAPQDAGQESSDDVAKFTQWLEGLKQR